MQATPPGLSRATAFTLALCCAFSVATIYYNQAMPSLIGDSFALGTAQIGQVAMLTQVGYAAGLLLFVPLGDRLVRRRLILALLVGNALVGLSAVSAQVIIPAATSLAASEQRGWALGLMVSGLSAGGLLARTLSGGVSHWLGWRGMFLLAALLDALLFAAILLRMPLTRPTSDQPYPALLRSILGLLREHPALRWSSLAGALAFAALNVFWGSMAALLAQPPYGYSSAQAGLFGLSAIAGILAASYLGRLTQQHGMRLSYLGAGALLATFAGLYLAGPLGLWLPLLLAATLLDIGNRANQLANQARVLALAPDAVSRLNTAFMVSYFAGGAAGSALGAVAAGHAGWHGLALVGAGFALAALLAVWLFDRRRCAERAG
jgi:predicted MFS family arabinose efflux permease